MNLTRLFGIGQVRAAALREIGIADCDALDDCDAARLAEDMQWCGLSMSRAEIEAMRFHMQSYREKRPILFGRPPPLGESFIAFDLEFDGDKPHVWLIGLSLVDPHRRQNIGLWADDPEAERENLERLAEILAERPRLPIVTWAGNFADIPQLRSACRRARMKGLVEEVEERHVDLYAHAEQILRLPIPTLKLGDVAAFFGADKASSIADGSEALELYNHYLTLSHQAKREIKLKLVTYNFDDLEALVHTQRAIERLPVEKPQMTLVGDAAS